MEPSTTTTRPSKKYAKKQKQTRKQQSQVYTRKQMEQQLKNIEDDKSQSQLQDPILKRAMKWWERIDDKYFRTITLEDAINKRDICTSNQVLSIGSLEQTYAINYKEEAIYSVLPSLAEKSRIKVLYKTLSPSYSTTIAIYNVESAIPNFHSDVPDSLQQAGVSIISKFSKNMMIEQNQIHKNSIFQNPSQMKSIRLDLQEIVENEGLCQRIEKVEEIETNSFYPSEIDKEIAMWEWELQRVNQENHINWNKLIKNIHDNPNKLKVREMGEFDEKIMKIRDKLTWATVLRSFQHGFKDKTRKMLEAYIENEKNFNSKPPKGLTGTNAKKFFQTDCKICFCSDNNDSNQVLYCDNCNTSFHLACYGLMSVPLEDQYFCQRCTYMKKQQIVLGVKPKRLHCQICFKTNFPMKKMGEHFYHVTCLILFNFVEFNESKMVLKGSLTHQNITKMIIENQLQHEQCGYCRKIGGGTELGMQIKCCYNGCQNYFHPICAYMIGCKFELKAPNNKILEVNMFCNDHLGSRMEQVYLRRYMCNFGDTSSKSLNQFKTAYENEQQNLVTVKDTLIKTRKKYPNRILMMTKFIKNMLKSRMQKEQDQIQTQTQAILKKLKNKSL